MIKAVIFDMGGVITGKVLRRIAKDLAEKHNMDFEKLNNAVHSRWDEYKLGKISADEFWQFFADTGGVQETVEELKNTALEHLEEIPGTMDIARSLKGRYKLGVLSNNTQEWIEHEEKKLCLSDVFDAVVVSNEEGTAKPDPRFFNAALEKLGNLKPEECIFIDDQKNNVEAAKRLGFAAIKFESPGQLKKELKNLGVEA